MSRTNHIFVDFENIPAVDLDLVAGKPVVVHLILGEAHKKLPVEMVRQLMKHPGQVRLVEAGRSGRNALDFVLAYRVGVEVAADPQAYFHVVSKDTGFEALIAHLRKQNILARRDDSFAKAFEPSEPLSTTPAERLEKVTEWMTKPRANRPKKKKTLVSQINACFGKKLAESELEVIVKALVARKIVKIGLKGEVDYLV